MDLNFYCLPPALFLLQGLDPRRVFAPLAPLMGDKDVIIYLESIGRLLRFARNDSHIYQIRFYS